jgi:dipeptidyl aminopeptidase/acylaminoacyl peptidase
MTDTVELPFGSWPSPLQPESMGAASLRLGAARLGPGGEVYWMEGRPVESGRTVLVRRLPDGTTQDLLPPPYDARSRVHEYGGGAFSLGGGEEIYFVNAADQAIYRVDPGQAPVPLSPGAPEWRFGDLVFDRARQRILAVAERRLPGAAEPANLIVSVAATAQPASAPQILVDGADFYASPTPSADGQRLAYLSWNHPHMPWDAAALHLATLDAAGQSGRPTDVRHVAGDARASAQQPAFGPDGQLYFLWEPDGYWNLFRASPDGGPPRPVAPAEAELGLPPWGLGTSTWGFLDDHTVLAAEIHQGVTRLCRIELATGARTALPCEVAAVSHLETGPRGQAAIVASFADRPAAVSLLEVNDSVALRTLRASSPIVLSPEDVSRAQPVSFPTSEGDTAHGFFYPPQNQHARPVPGQRPPLVLLVHGGPTAATSAGYSPSVQFWTTRGFAVFDLNYRGSTGYGRRYRDRLQGQWGVYDVEDCQAAVRALIAQGRVDPARVAIRGSSAGGYTVLAALCADGTFHAGSSLYGISDLSALTRDTHKFESRYCDGLVGPWPARADLYAARSPLNHADRMSCPVIFFQGLDDKVVPPPQTEALVTALQQRVPVEYHRFPGEQHGFRRAENICTVYESELAFFGRAFGFEPAGPGRGR